MEGLCGLAFGICLWVLPNPVPKIPERFEGLVLQWLSLISYRLDYVPFVRSCDSPHAHQRVPKCVFPYDYDR